MREKILVRGGGDMATGTIHRLHRSGFPVLVLECEAPTAIRRKVAFSEAVYEGTAEVEGIRCRRIHRLEETEAVWRAGEVPLLVDPQAQCAEAFGPYALVDAILAKRNLGTRRDMAPLTIALGPGFNAGEDVDFVVETMRGHDLGRIFSTGQAAPNTGVPGIIAGYGAERVIHAPASGTLHSLVHIGDWVEEGQPLARIGQVPVPASLTGVVRGLIRDGFLVEKGLKIADIDPRSSQQKNCFTISDKARCIAGSVLEILLHSLAEREETSP